MFKLNIRSKTLKQKHRKRSEYLNLTSLGGKSKFPNNINYPIDHLHK